MIKLIASDMDGTLVNGQLEISDENTKAIKVAQKRKILFCIATGRDYREASIPLIEQKITCPIITLNGAHLFDETGETIGLNAIDNKTTHQLWKIFKAKGVYAELMTNQGVFGQDAQKRLHYFIAYIGETMPHLIHQQALEMAHTYLDHFHLHYVEDILEVADREDEDIEILKIFVADDNLETLAQITQEIQATFPELVITSSGAYNIEINHKSAQKGIAVLKLAQKYKIKPEEIMTLGDSLNDVSMLKLAQINVAMENANPEVKKIATHITTSNENSGVAKAIWHILNGEWK
ncbi:MAG: Cof-type HAD-IIB family hydrolase [Streptococcaceae bacterium]|jgi:Cof subfamily protein (haloacid dehalogenase superfamily)|nr:Cof-type HAD-IIB family hydrolase [Streptococcaceae bacterium]